MKDVDGSEADRACFNLAHGAMMYERQNAASFCFRKKKEKNECHLLYKGSRSEPQMEAKLQYELFLSFQPIPSRA